MTEAAPLTPEQRLAASRLAAGEAVQDIADDLGVHPKTVSQRWNERDDFRALVRRQREALVGEVESPEEVARAALVATRSDGRPDWNARLTACKILMTAPITSPEARAEAARVERIYVSEDE